MREILEKLARGEISVDEAEKLLKLFEIAEIEGLARIDLGRGIRRGVPEIIVAEGKSTDEVLKIAKRMLDEVGRAIISRASEDLMKISLPGAIVEVHERARIVVLKREGFRVERTGGKVGILTAGTSDIRIAEEAGVIAEEMGCEVLRAYDVGIAGLHRLFEPLKEMIREDVDVLIVVAGREGALASLVAGLVDIPVIAVPSSSGYGFGGRGLSALMSMLQSCPLGLAVVNIDGGVPAGVVASLIANRVAKYRRREKI
ncbi:nickel pincer cofactor biosynthesis protein LarB [Candidatus Korarchaeum cryptofilum]|uniref:1-(5-phosphoribosyl)-5-amino-4-imidazole-carboxylate (AIR) carboxylase n=1 Tax=Korarchaeum cryptofilum (strain OPF8) TaxID=374847 RepID=B1L453_KORCO|nr:nickel pincer cofactor biosynthesis protein LarB [Candidatus Korarchaeum cryptofilum]ACB07232.1 1-(5-phosphoribosyl)-5-amino-4-imidazole-carboxylate (AIR) carboxylase [Candidatus Korarchaeum cryptofilum OPF8]